GRDGATTRACRSGVARALGVTAEPPDEILVATAGAEAPAAPEEPAAHDTDPSVASAPATPEGPAPLTLGDAPGAILPGDRCADAGRKAMWPHVERLITREALLADPEATDGLKRYRVATRRLRAGLRVFREAYSGRATRGIRRELSKLADAVGVVRDLDVRIA